MGAAPEAPPLFGGVMKLVGATPTEPSGALTAFLTGVQMRERVVAERATVAAASSPTVLAEEENELALAKRLLAVLEANKGKFPPGFDLAEFTAKVVGEGAAGEAATPSGSLPAATKAAVVGE